MLNFIHEMEGKALNREYIDFDEAYRLITVDNSYLFDFIASSNRIRERFKGKTISLCSIINAKSGRCPEDCAFCSQSIHHKSSIQEYPLVETDKILEGAKMAITHGAHKFGIVTSGKGINNGNELDEICNSVNTLKNEIPIHRCASLGILSREAFTRLRDAGLQEYHHNLETARSFFNNVCTTHTYDEDVETIRFAKDAGFRTCCGGVFGMGESVEQRIELAFTLRELDVDSIPLNFLHPIRGTPLENTPLLKPIEALKIIALYRFILPDKDIKVAGGREYNLRDLQSLVFAAGANSIMVGNYLTTKGRNYREDLQMIRDLGLMIKRQVDSE
ncbi:MAG: biotin synthase BioB [Nitrospinae bacterium RIFCSPLOWO2_02_FULL_39_110]|nr:MAG: biotin synthase BioB [Nitrospinae bacterium RIFCSPHIGHO2_02_39_11]OGW00096.1 MAG: biotin synthase BioB [Nitrospinae bacterium RIFCSPHIGHO2_02_FULL_39_82]OGW00350.1 MAG: biotin synthase BioB [Nitrospinae bacterium RIFCSPHIGHO2_12_FULL_39_42]OGW03842.1 MAG: biotin synthase BioB [Nitrospinae bacterium RIFCSPLOWO2_02_FULL_39_110]OGW05195.1 MAG: biotin synthase BioB [Nitrospinae bacterium RIFCSPLOWO2_02_39_17]OGW08002.1 MAG: biotin synthase BioB [Nitrospinae bacterium RIFCSPLOWO2_12_39_15]